MLETTPQICTHNAQDWPMNKLLMASRWGRHTQITSCKYWSTDKSTQGSKTCSRIVRCIQNVDRRKWFISKWIRWICTWEVDVNYQSLVVPLWFIKQVCMRIYMAADVIITHAVTNGPSVAMDTSLVIMDTVPVCWNMEDKNKNENTFYHNFCYKNNSLLNGRKRQSDLKLLFFII